MEDTVIRQSDQIELYRLMVIRSRLKLESLGMRFRCNTVPAAKAVLAGAGVKPGRSKKVLLEQMTQWINSKKQPATGANE
ncbi:MAG: hypothetical protein NTZ35_00200 [Ignavibacteriales bacterium]|nr:hypothetical protein [Ignavibacteriales bacterium]